ncbi:MAG: peptidoglycan-binding domain-containing protein [Synechococcaceae cyanobacterium]
MAKSKLLLLLVCTSAAMGLSSVPAESASSHSQGTRGISTYNVQISQDRQQYLPVVMPGDRGQAVLTLQQNLKELGYYSGLLDGVYEEGFILSRAVRKFQSEHGLDADGVVGRATWAAIQSELNRR